MSGQVNPMSSFLQAIERERKAWDALQHPPSGTPANAQSLHAAWVQAVNAANEEAERFLQANPPRSLEGDGIGRRPNPGDQPQQAPLFQWTD